MQERKQHTVLPKAYYVIYAAPNHHTLTIISLPFLMTIGFITWFSCLSLQDLMGSTVIDAITAASVFPHATLGSHLTQSVCSTHCCLWLFKTENGLLYIITWSQPLEKSGWIRYCLGPRKAKKPCFFTFFFPCYASPEEKACRQQLLLFCFRNLGSGTQNKILPGIWRTLSMISWRRMSRRSQIQKREF